MRFILIDRVLEIDPGRSALATRTFSPDDEIFRDHFPGIPLVPGSLVLEAMIQTAGAMIVAAQGTSSWPLPVMIQNAKFRSAALPGEELTIKAELESERGPEFCVKASARVADRRIAEVRLVLRSFDQLPAEGDAAQFENFKRAVHAGLVEVSIPRKGE
jgi:3-hydroxyacyl-[acyl-carrier-protein] dehydratase